MSAPLIKGKRVLSFQALRRTSMSANDHEQPWVREHLDAGVLFLTLNRPDKYNVLSDAMMSALRGCLNAAATNADVRVIVIAADGKAFSAGHDLNEMGAEHSVEDLQALFSRCTQLMLTIQRQPQPVIARVQGVATAAGCQLVAMCDLAIAADTAKFAVSGINLGLFCSTPAVALSRNISRKAALEMLLTGEFIDAATAQSKGLVNRVVPAVELDNAVRQLTSTIVAKSADAISAGKALFYRQLEVGVEQAFAMAGEVMACNAHFPDARAGIAKFTRKS
jgi:enoyl-CoA hydratase/carnithine racemase